jgi:vacuolar-type H+-ATPase subunit H
VIDKGQKEMQDLLKEGAAALKEMRKGIENACAELRGLYSKTLSRSHKSANLNEKKIYKRQNNQGSNVAYN